MRYNNSMGWLYRYFSILIVVLSAFIVGQVFAFEDVPERYDGRAVRDTTISYDATVDTITTGAQNPLVRFYLFITLYDGFSEKFIKETFPTLDALYKDRVQFIFAPNPYLSLQNGNFVNVPGTYSTLAYALCASDKGLFWKDLTVFYDKKFETKLLEMSPELEECAGSAKTQERIMTYFKRAKSVPNINLGSPIFIIQSTSTGKATLIFGAQAESIFVENIDNLLKQPEEPVARIPKATPTLEIVREKGSPPLFDRLIEWIVSKVGAIFN